MEGRGREGRKLKRRKGSRKTEIEIVEKKRRKGRKRTEGRNKETNQQM